MFNISSSRHRPGPKVTSTAPGPLGPGLRRDDVLVWMSVIALLFPNHASAQTTPAAPAAAPVTPAAAAPAKPAPPEWLAKGTLYSPSGCEFEVTLPETPYTTQQCDALDKTSCSDRTTFTKVFGLDATLTYNVACNTAAADMYDKYDDNVMRTTLIAMARPVNLDTSQTGFGALKEAKMAVLLGSGKSDNGRDDMLYTAQLWVGHKSIFTIEGQLRGKYLPEADQMFADILRTAKLKGTATPIDDAKKPDTSKKKKSADKTK